NPLEGEALSAYRVLSIDISHLTQHTVKALDGVTVSNKDSLRSKNMWALGLVLWLFDREVAPTREWLERRFANRPDIARINIAALAAAYHFGEPTAPPPETAGYDVPTAQPGPRRYT